MSKLETWGLILAQIEACVSKLPEALSHCKVSDQTQPRSPHSVQIRRKKIFSKELFPQSRCQFSPQEKQSWDYDAVGNRLHSASDQTDWHYNANQHYYYLNDHLGSPSLMISSSGQVVWQARMEAFGEVSVSINQIDNQLRFPGQYHDVETGLYYNFHRYYAPKLGRYITSDPIGLAGGVNTYGYVGGNPIGLIDPLGLQANPLNVLRVTPWQIVLRVLTNPVGDSTVDAWRREHPGEELPTFPNNVDPNAVYNYSDADKTQGSFKEYKNERSAYSTICKTKRKDPDPCEEAKMNRDRLKTCLALRIAFKAKWHPNDSTHITEIENTRKAVENAEKKVAELCGNNC